MGLKASIFEFSEDTSIQSVTGREVGKYFYREHSVMQFGWSGRGLVVETWVKQNHTWGSSWITEGPEWPCRVYFICIRVYLRVFSWVVAGSELCSWK